MPLLRLAGTFVSGLTVLFLVACGGSDAPQSFTATPIAPDVAPAEVILQSSLSTTYYQISGLTTESIFDDIELLGPKDNQGQLGSGLTSVVWGYSWTGDRRSDGSCAIREMTIRADMTIKLPQHSDEGSLSENVLGNWREYSRGVAEHEQRHVDIYLEGANDIKGDMQRIGVAGDCDQLETQIQDIWEEQQTRINDLQEEFHSQEEVRLAATRGPIEEEIDRNRAELDSIQAQVAELDRQMGALKAEIDLLDVEADDVDSQIAQINDQFPDDPPQTVRDRLEDLVRRNNELLITYNEKVDQHNGALAQRNTLASQYENLLATTNDLVDQYNWAR